MNNYLFYSLFIIVGISICIFHIIKYQNRKNQIIDTKGEEIKIPVLQLRFHIKNTIFSFVKRVNNFNPIFIFKKDAIEYRIAKIETQKYSNIDGVDIGGFLYTHKFIIHFIDKTLDLHIWVPTEKQLIDVLKIFQKKNIELSDKATELLSNN